MKRCSTSLAFREMHIKLQWDTISVKTTIINKTSNNTCRRGCGEKGTLIHCWWECRLVQPLWKTAWQFLKQFRVIVWLSNPSPGHLPKKIEAIYRGDIYTPMFTAALLMVAKTWRQLKCPSIDDWIKMQYTLGWCGSIDWALACEPKGHRFNSQSGQMPGSLVRPPSWGHVRWPTNVSITHDVSLPLFLPPFLSL